MQMDDKVEAQFDRAPRALRAYIEDLESKKEELDKLTAGLAKAVPFLSELLESPYSDMSKIAAAVVCALQRMATSDKLRSKMSSALPTLVSVLTKHYESKYSADLYSDLILSEVTLLRTLAHDSQNMNAIRECGGIKALVALLSSNQTVSVKEKAAETLSVLIKSHDDNNKAAHQAGAIVHLITMLSRSLSENGYDKARYQGLVLLASLTIHTSSRLVEVIDAGAITLLVALLSAKRRTDHPKTAKEAAVLLGFLSGDAAGASATLDEIGSDTLILNFIATTAHSLSSEWHLSKEASARLQRAVIQTDQAALRSALDVAEAAGVDRAELARCEERLQDLAQQGVLQAKRKMLGVDHIALPDDMMCPITHDKFIDPVMASDGHTYEKSALKVILSSDSPVSPLTRDRLQKEVCISNINMRKRIREYDSSMIEVAEAAAKQARVAAPMPFNSE